MKEDSRRCAPYPDFWLVRACCMKGTKGSTNTGVYCEKEPAVDYLTSWKV